MRVLFDIRDVLRLGMALGTCLVACVYPRDKFARGDIVVHGVARNAGHCSPAFTLQVTCRLDQPVVFAASRADGSVGPESGREPLSELILLGNVLGIVHHTANLLEVVSTGSIGISV